MRTQSPECQGKRPSATSRGCFDAPLLVLLIAAGAFDKQYVFNLASSGPVPGGSVLYRKQSSVLPTVFKMPPILAVHTNGLPDALGAATCASMNSIRSGTLTKTPLRMALSFNSWNHRYAQGAV